jgi:hypothetical protein
MAKSWLATSPSARLALQISARSKDIEVELNEFTLSVGANNSGKTSFPDAFYGAIGAARRGLASDTYPEPDESDVPKEPDLPDYRSSLRKSPRSSSHPHFTSVCGACDREKLKRARRLD